MTKNNYTVTDGRITQKDEEIIKDHRGEIVEGTVEDEINMLFDADADRRCAAKSETDCPILSRRFTIKIDTDTLTNL